MRSLGRARHEPLGGGGCIWAGGAEGRGVCVCVCAHVLTKVGDVVSITTAICFQSWLLLDGSNVFFSNLDLLLSSMRSPSERSVSTAGRSAYLNLVVPYQLTSLVSPSIKVIRSTRLMSAVSVRVRRRLLSPALSRFLAIRGQSQALSPSAFSRRMERE